jgi:hypothetical protein
MTTTNILISTGNDPSLVARLIRPFKSFIQGGRQVAAKRPTIGG